MWSRLTSTFVTASFSFQNVREHSERIFLVKRKGGSKHFLLWEPQSKAAMPEVFETFPQVTSQRADFDSLSFEFYLASLTV